MDLFTADFFMFLLYISHFIVSRFFRTFYPLYYFISGAPLLSKFGNLSIREILNVTYSHVTVRPSVRPHRLCGKGRGVPRQPDGAG